MKTEIGQEQTFQDFWDNIKTDSVALKVNYFIRNEAAIRSAVKVACPLHVNGETTKEMGQRWATIDELTQFLSSKCTVVRFPNGHFVARDSGDTDEQFEIQFSIYSLPNKCERLMRTYKVVRSSSDKDWTTIPD